MKNRMVRMILPMIAISALLLSGCGNEPAQPAAVIMEKNDGKLFSEEARENLEENRQKFAAEVEAYKKDQAEREARAKREYEELMKRKQQKQQN